MSWIRRRLVTNAKARGYAIAPKTMAPIIDPTVHGHSNGHSRTPSRYQNSSSLQNPSPGGPALHELRTAATGTVCALSNCARALRDLSGAGRLPLGRRRLTTVRRAGVSGLSPLQLLGGWIRPVSLWRLRARSSGLSSFFVPDRGGMLWTFSTPPTILLLTRLL
jgi:hypothetical protein